MFFYEKCANYNIDYVVFMDSANGYGQKCGVFE